MTKYPDTHYRHRGKNAPREMWQVWEAEKCAKQTPTWFSSKMQNKPSARSEWMKGGSDLGHDTANSRHKTLRKARITLAKVWVKP